MVYDRFEWADAVNASLPGHELVVCELLQWITDSFNERCNDVAHPPGPPIGLILHGCSGTGKSALCSTLVQHKPATIQAVYIQGEEIYQHEDPMAAINSSIASCEADKPTLLIVDNISSMCPVNSKHDTIGNSRVEDTVVEQLSYLLDSWRDAAWSPEVLCSTTMETKATIPIASSKQLFVLGTTTRVESVHPSIRRMDRLGLFVHLQAPSRSARKDILHGIVGCNHVPGQYPNDDILEHIAGTTPGYLPADLKLLHAEAVLEAVKEADSLDLANDSRTKHLPACLAPPTLAHYTTALHRCRPAHLSDISGSLLRPVSFDDLGGLDEIIDDVAFMAQLCFDRKTECDRRGIRPPQGVLILGSAGVGKTQLAMAVAHSQQVNVVPIVATAIRAKVVGQAEAALQALFRKAIESEPCVLLLDQIDAIAARRPEGGQGISLIADSALVFWLCSMHFGYFMHMCEHKLDIHRSWVLLQLCSIPTVVETRVACPLLLVDHVLFILLTMFLKCCFQFSEKTCLLKQSHPHVVLWVRWRPRAITHVSQDAD
eukprot:m.900221 g.900221  ORF g.900221 m.900221 type:complete len:544 (+) comp23684_c0_seq32:2226-3857(+)